MIKNNSIHPDAKSHLFDGPIPGQSLTNSPDEKYPWEQAPELTSQKETTNEIKKWKPGQGGELHITDAIKNLINKDNKL